MDATFFALAVVILLFSVILHEVMHGWVALKFGDRTAERSGRLTLNPIPHIDPIGTILVPALLILPALITGNSPGFIFGWAKPVPVNPLNFNDIKKGELATSLAGIASNLALALVAALAFHPLTSLAPHPILGAVLGALAFAVNINLILAIFNLLPIPPLDGSRVVMALLPHHLVRQYAQLERYGIFILILMWFIPFGNTTLLWAILGFFLNIFHTLLGV